MRFATVKRFPLGNLIIQIPVISAFLVFFPKPERNYWVTRRELLAAIKTDAVVVEKAREVLTL